MLVAVGHPKAHFFGRDTTFLLVLLAYDYCPSVCYGRKYFSLHRISIYDAILVFPYLFIYLVLAVFMHVFRSFCLYFFPYLLVIFVFTCSSNYVFQGACVISLVYLLISSIRLSICPSNLSNLSIYLFIDLVELFLDSFTPQYSLPVSAVSSQW